MVKISVDNLKTTLRTLTDIGLNKQQVIKYIENLGLCLLKESKDTLDCNYEGSLVFFDPEDTFKNKEIFRVELNGYPNTGISTVAVVGDHTKTNFDDVMRLLELDGEIDQRLARNIYLMGYFQRISDEKEISQ